MIERTSFLSRRRRDAVRRRFALYVLWLCVATVAAPLAGGAEVPRIGIISDVAARKEADLLLIELQKAKCEMVERDEIGKVLQEQSLTAVRLTSALSLQVGRLLKADGLCFYCSAGEKP